MSPQPEKAPLSRPESAAATPSSLSALSQAQPAPPKPVTMRDFGDAPATRKLIFDNALEAARSIQPVANQRYSLHIADVDYEDPETLPYAAEKKAILEGQTLGRRLRGTWVLSDNAGKELQRKRTTLAKIPYLHDGGTFLIGGNDVGLAHQLRLLGGAYTRRKENGTLESHFNPAVGKGLAHRYELEPATGVFRLNFQQSSVPLLPVLRAMGLQDRDLLPHWGAELLAANQAKEDPRTIDKLYAKLMRKPNLEAGQTEKAGAIVQALQKMEFDPEVNKRTLGKPHARLTAEAILDVTKKLLAVNRGEADPDDRDHMANQVVMGPEDLIAERLRRSAPLMNQLLWKVSTKGELKSVLPFAFDRHVHGAIQDSGLGNLPDGVNPLELLNLQHRVTRMGTGGLPSSESIPMSARAVQPSQAGYIDPLVTPESGAVGVDGRFASGAKKGSDGRMYSLFTNPETGEKTWKSPQDVADLTLAFPGELEDKNDPFVRVIQKGRLRMFLKENKPKIDLILPGMEGSMTAINNLVPVKSMMVGQRASMASRFISQALPLVNAEAPLVRSQVPGQPGVSYEEHFSQRVGAVRARAAVGRVASVTPDEIVVKYADGRTETHQLHNHRPENRKTELHNTALVQPGDPVQPGQLLATSNYTDANGHVALGVNARVAYTSWRGRNHNDGISISESFAKTRLVSQHLYQHQLDADDSLKTRKRDFVNIFPAAFSKKLLENIDDDGVVKPGTMVRPGEPLILGAAQRDITHKTVHAAHKGSFADHSVLWDHHDEGKVTDVSKTPNGTVVTVSAVSPTVMADKMTGRYAEKGVITDIVPDDEMPIDPKTKLPYEVLLNPGGIHSRGNAGQMVEAALGKIAAKTGKPYVIPDFENRGDMREWAEQELAKHGLTSMEEIEDPKTGHRTTVLTGNRWFMKLLHQSEHKSASRGLGGYAADDSPARGGPDGAKRVAVMHNMAYVAHGALDALRDIKLVKGQKNQEYWATRMAGYKPATPPVPLVYRKFLAQLKGAGVNPVRNGTQTQLMAMTNADIDEITGGRVIENVATVDWKDGLKPIKGGLFDPTATGAHGGLRWSAIPLHEPMPSPVFEEPIRRLLRLTAQQYEDVIAGKSQVGGRTGPGAIGSALSELNLDREIDKARQEAASGRKGLREAAVRRLGFLRGCARTNRHPKDWMLAKVPVIPPLYRPVSLMSNGQTLVSDANYLYAELFNANKALTNLTGKIADTGEERLNVYHALKAVVGLGDSTQPKNQERGVRGLLKTIFGDRSKFSVVQQKLLGSSIDLVGRAPISPNPDLTMDEAGLPEDRAWAVYNPFIVSRLVKKGVGRVQALQYVNDKHPLARQALLDEMQMRPVIVDRAPVLHKYGVLALWPKLVRGNTLQFNPLIEKGLGADFDGDAMNYHVPASDEAVHSAVRHMLPSKNLISPADFKTPMFAPIHEYAGGLHTASSSINKGVHSKIFATVKDLVQAYERGEVHVGDPVEVVEK